MLRPGKQGGVFSSRGCACFLLCMVEDRYRRPEPVRVPGSLGGRVGVGRAYLCPERWSEMLCFGVSFLISRRAMVPCLLVRLADKAEKRLQGVVLPC